SISSQTHPQNVQVAFFTIVRLIACLALLGLVPARTGRQHERSAQLPAAITSPNPARPISPRIDQFPGLYLLALALAGSRQGYVDAVRHWSLLDFHVLSLHCTL